VTTQVGLENPLRTDLEPLHLDPTSIYQGPVHLHWFPRELNDPDVRSEVRYVSQGIVRPTVGISPSVMASSRDVTVDTRAGRPLSPFVDSDTQVGRFSPIVAAAPSSIDAAPSPLSRGVDSDTRIKRLYAATHAPVAPPSTPLADLLCHECVLSSSDSDSDVPPTAGQRENRPPLLGTRFRCPSGSSVHSTAASTDALRQYVQLTSQLAATVQQQLERTQTEAAQREHRMFNDTAEREHRLLADAAERDRRACELEAQREQRLLADARQARELDAQREQLLLHDAKCTREALLADVQLQRDREAQREIDFFCVVIFMISLVNVRMQLP